MTSRSATEIFSALNDTGSKYLVVGGLAVVAHGYLRFTADIDLVIQLVPQNIEKTLSALKALGYHPRIPEPIESFADEKKRKLWVKEKGMMVFQLDHDKQPATTIDIFVDHPFDFDTEHQKANWVSLNEDTKIPVVALATLIAMKEEAGRDTDKEDITKLKILYGLEDE